VVNINNAFDIRRIKRCSKNVFFFHLAVRCEIQEVRLGEISIFIGPLFAGRAGRETVSPRAHTEIEEIAI
jgi:hypothetical protein